MRGRAMLEGIMTIQRMDNVGAVVDGLAATTAFFLELGLERLCYVRGPEGIIVALSEKLD
jgi:hypothetical protein